MSGGARVDSIDAIKEFRIYLAKFQESARIAMSEADSEINRAITWLEGEQTNHWVGQIRKRQEILSKAEAALLHKRLFKDPSGSRQSIIDEQKAVQVAQRNLAEANQKAANVKKWKNQLLKEATAYRGNVSAFDNSVTSLTTGVGHLGGTIEMLEKYLGLGPAPLSDQGAAAVSTAGSGAKEPAGSMSRAPDEAAGPQAPTGPDLQALRKSLPAKADLESAAQLGRNFLKLAFGPLTAKQRNAFKQTFAAQEPDEKQLVAVSAAATWSPNVYLVHGAQAPAGAKPESIWYLGSVDAVGSEVYNGKASLADLRLARQDFAELLTMPPGHVALLGPGGVSAIYDAADAPIWSAQATPAQDAATASVASVAPGGSKAE